MDNYNSFAVYSKGKGKGKGICCWIFPLETLPPGDPNGGGVYLRIVFLQRKHLACLSLFLERDYPGK
jgi:hypothetical protein